MTRMLEKCTILRHCDIIHFSYLYSALNMRLLFSLFPNSCFRDYCNSFSKCHQLMLYVTWRKREQRFVHEVF